MTGIEPLEKGMVISCPGCRKELFRTQYRLVGGDPITADLMEPMSPNIPKPHNQEPMNCPLCNVAYGIGGTAVMFYTSKGWMGG